MTSEMREPEMRERWIITRRGASWTPWWCLSVTKPGPRGWSFIAPFWRFPFIAWRHRR